MSAPDSAPRPQYPAALIAGLALMALSILLTFTDPAMPAADLDSSWALASEYALKHGLAFGRDFIFTFGPYNPLATRIYDPATFPLVLVYDVFSVVAVFWTALRNRSVVAAIALALCALVLRFPSDALSPLALFGVFLICLQRRTLWALAFVLLAGPIVLSKLSFAIVLLPLMALADAERISARRLPWLTLAAFVGIFAAYLLAGQPAGAFPAFLVNSLEIILGYGKAMAIPGDRLEQAVTIAGWALALLFVGVLAGRQWRAGGLADLRPVTVFLGFAWLMFALFKMGFVRQDVHTMVSHLAAPAGLAMAVSWFDTPERRTGRTLVVYGLALVAALFFSFYWRSVSISRFNPDPAVRPVKIEGADLAQDTRRVLLRLGPRLATGVKWASGQGFAAAGEKRKRAEAALVRPFPASVTGSVDVIPWDLAPVIASGLDYRPRPVPQSYSAYTPGLQRLDAAHFAGPRAPDTLILRIEDVDGRLPSLALGPSLPVIGRRYDAVDRDPLGLILRRRATPRAMAVRQTPPQGASLGEWIATPGAPGRLVMAKIAVKRSLTGQLAGFLVREPVMRIGLRTASGREATYRFVPDMARLGTAVSPMPADWASGAAVLLDPAGGGEPVTAIRLSADDSPWAFKSATVSFDVVTPAPGFAVALPH